MTKKPAFIPSLHENHSVKRESHQVAIHGKNYIWPKYIQVSGSSGYCGSLTSGVYAEYDGTAPWR
ncbi:MAG: hypothetical protein V3U20_03460 [Thermoplasmata archaeon]